MDIFVLLATMFACFIIGMPIAYSLAAASIAGALWIGIPVEAVMLQISSGVSEFAMLTIPFFVLAGAIMAEGGMARRLVALANVMVGIATNRERTIHAGALVQIDARNHNDPVCLDATADQTGHACIDEEHASYTILTPNVPTDDSPSPARRRTCRSRGATERAQVREVLEGILWNPRRVAR